MKRKKSLIARMSALAILAATLFVTSAGAATTKVLYTFNSANGEFPVSGVIFDQAGNLYGTTPTGGSKDCGVVYQLTSDNQGKWTQSVIFEFDCLNKGGNPMTTLTLDAQGNLYGTTWLGGSHAHGTVFRLTKGQNGVWTEKVLHDFAWSADGGAPAGTLVFDGNGSLYGTSFSGGAFGFGNVFKLSPDNQDHWTLDTLHSFNRDQRDGYNPLSGVVIGADGSLFGATKEGGSKGFGVVYQLIPDGNGKWKEKIIHTFNPDNGRDGAYPQASLLVDAAGSLLGSTASGGKDRFYGVIFRLSFDLVSQKWQYSILHSFTNAGDGGQPFASLIQDAAGAYYGTTLSGGISGTAFKLSLADTGKYKETVLHKFKNGTDGSKPHSGLIFDGAGNMYGTTQEGGSNNMGTVFKIIP